MKRRHKCPACGGKGTIPLTGIYLETLFHVADWCRQHGGFLVANQAAAEFGCKGSALSNRLNQLERSGYLRSWKYGKQRRFALRS